MTVTVEDIRIELQREELTSIEEEFLRKKITYYTDKAEKIAPQSPREIKDEYITAAVIKDYKTGISSFSDGRFTMSIDKEEIIRRCKKALHRLYGTRIWKP